VSKKTADGFERDKGKKSKTAEIRSEGRGGNYCSAKKMKGCEKKKVGGKKKKADRFGKMNQEAGKS